MAVIQRWPGYRGWWCTRIVLVDGVLLAGIIIEVTCQIRWLLAQVPLYHQESIIGLACTCVLCFWISTDSSAPISYFSRLPCMRSCSIRSEINATTSENQRKSQQNYFWWILVCDAPQCAGLLHLNFLHKRL